jgi:hypothetical protein
MLSDDNEKGVFHMLLGIVAVFLVAIAFAGFAKTFSFSGDGAIKQEMSDLDMTLSRQESLLDAMRASYERDQTSRESDQKEYDTKLRQVERQGEKISELKDISDILTSQLNEVQAGFDKYRQLYRTQARNEANGLKLDSITTRSGKVYKLATIRQVHVDGMSISYDGGVVRLGAEDLDVSWSQRFDWNAEEQLNAKKAEETPALQPVVAPARPAQPVARPEPSKVKRPAAMPDRSRSPEAEALRSQLTDLKLQILSVRQELSSAFEKSRSGKSRSVTGSLETWDSYIQRLEAHQRQLERQYILTRGKLTSLSPREPVDPELAQ